MPAADNALLENYFKHAHNPLNSFRVSDAFSALREALADYDIVETFGNEIYPIIVKARADSEAFRRAKERYKKRKQKPAKGFLKYKSWLNSKE